jgi:hypothetical protein
MWKQKDDGYVRVSMDTTAETTWPTVKSVAPSTFPKLHIFDQPAKGYVETIIPKVVSI